jgi:uncharacterized protein
VPAYIAVMSERREPKACVICGKPSAEGYSPFCSKRCADIDLHRWLSGGYAIPAAEEEGERADGDADPEARD